MTTLNDPVTFTEPSSSTRDYYGASVADVDGTVYIAVPYSDPAQGASTEQPVTYVGYSFNPSGPLTFNQANAIDSWFNADNPQNIPSEYLESGIRAFDGPTSQSDFAEYFETLNGNGTATYSIAVVNTSTATPTVTQVSNITTTPISKAATGGSTASLGTLSNNDEIFEVEGAPTAGQVQGTYIIFNSSGNVLFGPSTGFNFTDGKSHVFAAGSWNSSNFAQLVEVWNPSTGLADVQLGVINAATGGFTTGWTAPTEMQSINKLSWQFVNGSGAGMIVAAAGTNAAGVAGVSLDDVNDTTEVAGGAGGTIGKSLFIPYSGTVVTPAVIVGSGITDEYAVFWVDSTGMNIDLVNSNLQVLDTYNIAGANGAADVVALGNGQLLVTYGVQSSPTSAVEDAIILNTPPPASTSADMIMSQGSTGNYEIYDLGNNAVLAAYSLTNIAAPWQVAGLGDFSGTDLSDMMLRNTSSGAFEIVDVSNNNAGSPVTIGNVGLEWTVSGFGDFSGQPNETDMLMRDSSNGNFEVYDIANNTVASATTLGNVGLDWSVLGFGDFSGKANETDMLMRNSTTGNLELYDISNNQVTSATALGGVGSEWQFAGAGDFSGRPGETDMLMRDTNNGDFEVYDFENGAITSAAALGNVGLNWTVAGFGDFSGHANETDMLLRDSNTGNFELYDISNNTVTSATSLGNVGLDWQVDGIAPYQPAGAAAATSGGASVSSGAGAGAAGPSQIASFMAPNDAAPGAQVPGPTLAVNDAPPTLNANLFQHA
jgi:hypothetical protein